MKADVFESIVSEYQKLRNEYGIDHMKVIIEQLANKFVNDKLDYAALYSLVSYEYRKEAKIGQNQNLKNNWPEILADWNAGTSILQLAEKYNVWAYALLRQLSSELCENKELSKKWLKDPSLCEDGKLAYEIMLLNAHDIMNGLFYNQLCMNTGIAFEHEVRLFLDHQQISYMSENELRCRNYDVTPDFRLNIPLVAIRLRDSIVLYRSDDVHIPDTLNGETERIVVTWIECKALFASPECHTEYYDNQFYSYINRFGNGLVLYKLGFVTNLIDKFTRNLIISQEMPPLIESGN